MTRGWKTIPYAGDIPFDNSTNGYLSTNVQDAIEEGVTEALETPLFPMPLTYNGTINDGHFYGRSSLIPGDTTPLIVPADALFTRYTWSNGNSLADFTLIFRKNSTVATPFLTVSYVDTKFDAYELVTPQSFDIGDEIYIEHQDDGQNAQDVDFSLYFRALPS